jgi:hypothetical protein
MGRSSRQGLRASRRRLGRIQEINRRERLARKYMGKIIKLYRTTLPNYVRQKPRG